MRDDDYYYCQENGQKKHWTTIEWINAIVVACILFFVIWMNGTLNGCGGTHRLTIGLINSCGSFHPVDYASRYLWLGLISMGNPNNCHLETFAYYVHSPTTFVIIIIIMAVAFWIIIIILLAIEQQTQCRVLIISAACLFVSISPAVQSRITYGWVFRDTSIHSLSVYIQSIHMHCQLHKQTKDYENLFVRRCWKCPNPTRPEPPRKDTILCCGSLFNQINWGWRLNPRLLIHTQHCPDKALSAST